MLRRHSQSSHGNTCYTRRDSTTIVCGSRGIKEAGKGAVTPAEEGAVLRNIAIKQYSGVM